MPNYILPKIPERGTKEFREYAARVMLHDGRIISTCFQGNDASVTAIPVWDWKCSDYYIESECLPKPKSRRWPKMEEAMKLVCGPGFLVRFQGHVYSARWVVHKGGHYVTTEGVSAVCDGNYLLFDESHDGGQSWHPFGVEE